MKFMKSLREHRKGITGLVIGMVVTRITCVSSGKSLDSLRHTSSDWTSRNSQPTKLNASSNRLRKHHRLRSLQQRLQRVQSISSSADSSRSEFVNLCNKPVRSYYQHYCRCLRLETLSVNLANSFNIGLATYLRNPTI